MLEITIDILKKKEGNDWLVNKIMDKAGNKGTGNWITITTAELGVPSTLIASALFARYTSFYKDERIETSTNFRFDHTKQLNFEIESILNAYQFARILNHYQGFKLISEAGKAYQWNLNLSELARIWTNGCIIRSDLMANLVTVLQQTDNILTHPEIIDTIKSLRPSAAVVVSECILAGLPIPCLNESLVFLNGHSTANSSANIIQAQRDYFGAHTYQRTDDSSGKFYHTNWK